MIIRKFEGLFLIGVFLFSFFSLGGYAQGSDFLSGVAVIPLVGGGCEIVKPHAGEQVIQLDPNGFYSPWSQNINPATDQPYSALYAVHSDAESRKIMLENACKGNADSLDITNLNKLFDSDGLRGALGSDGRISFGRDGKFHSITGFRGNGEFEFGELGKFNGDVEITGLHINDANGVFSNGEFDIWRGTYTPGEGNKFVDALGEGKWDVTSDRWGSFTVKNQYGGKINFDGDDQSLLDISHLDIKFGQDGSFKEIYDLGAGENGLTTAVNGEELILNKNQFVGDFYFDKEGSWILNKQDQFGVVIGKGDFQYGKLQFGVTGDKSTIFKQALANENEFLYGATNAEKINPDHVKFLTDPNQGVRSIYIDSTRGNGVALPDQDNLINYGKDPILVKSDLVEGVGEFFDIQRTPNPEGNALAFVERRSSATYSLQYPVDAEKVSSLRNLEIGGQRIIDGDGNLMQDFIKGNADSLEQLGISKIELRQADSYGLSTSTVGGLEVSDGAIKTLTGKTNIDLTKKGWAAIGAGILAVGGVIAGIVAFSKSKKKKDKDKD